MAFQEFGEALQLLRTEKGLTIDDVARRIKIPGRTLRDFENGEQKSTLHPVYCRGFAKAYAEFLGMDKAVLEEFLNRLYPPEEEEYDAPRLIPPRRTEIVTPGRITALLLVILIAAGVWYVHANGWPEFSWLSSLTEFTKSSEEPAAAVSEDAAQTLNQAAAPAAPVPAGQSAGLPPDSAGNVFQAQDLDAALNMPGITPGPEDLLPPVQANSTLALPNADAASGPHRLVIATSTHDCWTESRVDKEEKRTVYLKSGQTHILTFQHSLTLRLGNITGVKLRLDGQPYEMPPGRGSTRDIFFGEAAQNAVGATP